MYRKWMVLGLLIISISQLCDGTERRNLGFQEKSEASNSTTYDCSPSASCLPCQYSEKSDDKYRCSETGFRIPYKCTATATTADVNNKSKDNGDNAAAAAAAKDKTSSTNPTETHEYVTYRSCTPDVNQQNLSVLGFEVLVLGLLLVSGSFVFLRRKKTVALAGTGGVRLQSNPRF